MPQKLSPTLVAFSGGEPLFQAGLVDESPDLSQPLSVEIGLTGNFKTRDFSLSTKQFDEMIANHGAASVDPAVDREHESWFSLSAQPALGWVKALSVAPASGDKRRSALVAKVELNDLGQHAVKNNHFRYVSMGFDKAGKHRQTGAPIGAVLDHLALVKNPFIQGMRPLSLALSANLGRMVEGDDPMELLSTKLRNALGLSADAPEEQIVAAFEAAKTKADADTKALAEKNAALEAQVTAEKAASDRAVGEVKSLAARLDAIDSEKWALKVKSAVADFRLTPIEGTEYEKLTGSERQMAEKLLALRTPTKPAVELPKSGTAAKAADGRIQAQNDAIALHMKSNPGLDEYNAAVACALANPELFGEVL